MEERDRHPPAGDPPVPAILRGRSAREILAQILHDDVLELEARCLQRLRDQALLIPHEHLYLRAAARIAHGALHYRGDPPLDVWIGKRISISVRELLDEERAWLHDPVRANREGLRYYAAFAGLLGMEPDVLRRGCARFHALPYDVRRPFYDLVVEGKAFETVVEETGAAAESIAARVARAARAIGMEPDELPGRWRGGTDDP